MKMLGVRLEKEEHQALRQRSVDEDRPISEIVRDAIDQYLAKPIPKPKPKAKVPA